ncbi:MAG: ABC transporter substrate-binding protein [Synergistaceae bacterium]|jgi:branched-chain amino acid transport system substrate-binding protein|nr:ABC transporter substrate-binding protein [Synergistaceae bacterium]
MKKFLLAWCAVLLAAGICQGADTIKIGVVATMTGQNAFGGQLELEGMELANKLHPEALGKKIELVIMDMKSDKVESANAASRLIESSRVNAIIGPYGSSGTMAAGEVAEVAGVPLMATAATNPLVTEGKKYVFRACFTDPFQGEAGANYAYNSLGYRKAAVMTDVASDYAVGLASFFRSNFVKLGGTIVADLKYQSGDTDFTSQLTEIISREPDVLFIPAYFAEGAIIMKQGFELGAKFRFMGGDAMDNPEIVTLGGEAVEGFLHTTFAYDPSMPDMNGEARAFTEAWAKEYPDKAPNANAAMGYDAYVLLFQAIVRAGKDDPKSIRDELEKTKDVPTVTGLTSFSSESHDPVKDLGIVEIKDKKKSYIYTIKP